jgi:hypothetical protein
MVEMGVAVVASCLPTIIPALKAIRDAKAMQSLHGSFSRILPLSKLSRGSTSASFSRTQSRRHYRSESTDTMNCDGSSVNDVGKGYQLKPMSSSEIGDTLKEQHSFQERNEHRIGLGV